MTFTVEIRLQLVLVFPARVVLVMVARSYRTSIIENGHTSGGRIIDSYLMIRDLSGQIDP